MPRRQVMLILAIGQQRTPASGEIIGQADMRSRVHRVPGNQIGLVRAIEAVSRPRETFM